MFYKVLAHVDLEEDEKIKALGKKHNLQLVLYSTNPDKRKGDLLLLPQDLDVAVKSLE